MARYIADQLQPGRVLAVTMRDPRTRAIFLPGRTVLTRELIEQIYRAGLAEYAAGCVGEGFVPIDDGEELPLSLPPKVFYEVKRLRLAASDFRAIQGFSVLVCAILYYFTKEQLMALSLGIAAAGIAGAYTYSLFLADRTHREIVRHNPVRHQSLDRNLRRA